ncbi:Cytochrome b-c1 complex subunit Rieske, mitochondrial [Lamellibrachia satsuma]|nr:Cytochrome b-c1 complex subunit Rieske, mitochondrial [Lamellibrachia satsuma]
MDVCAKTFVGNRFYSKTHHDMPFPHKSFTEERRDSTKSLTKPINDSETGRKLFTYLVVTAALIPANYGTKATVLQYVYNMTAAADVLAMARIEVNLSDIPEGSNVTVKWRNKPLLIRHRTAQQIARVQAVNLSDLRDQEPDNKRVQRPEWLVVIGICPHLGCAPIPNAGEYDGGYYCPCHGSHFDASGRIRKGPAPTNMELNHNYTKTVPQLYHNSSTALPQLYHNSTTTLPQLYHNSTTTPPQHYRNYTTTLP